MHPTQKPSHRMIALSAPLANIVIRLEFPARTPTLAKQVITVLQPPSMVTNIPASPVITTI